MEYRTALTLALALSAIVAVALVSLAPYIGAWNRLNDTEVWALRALAPLYLLPALRLVPYVKLERAVDFASIGRIELYAHLARLGAALIVAAL